MHGMYANVWQPVPLRVAQSILPGSFPRTAINALAPRRQLGQLQEQIPASLMVVGSLLGLAIAAGTAWVGIRAGLKEKGFLGVTGWVVGIAGGLSAILQTGGLAASVATASGMRSGQVTAEGTV